MGGLHPFDDSILQRLGDGSEFLNFRVAGDSRSFINAAAALGSKHLQRIDKCSIVADGQLQGFDCVVMGTAAFGDFVSRDFERQGRGLERGVVRDGEAPVGIEIRVGAGCQIPLNDCEQPRDFLAARFVRSQPAVFLPILKAHAGLQ